MRATASTRSSSAVTPRAVTRGEPDPQPARVGARPRRGTAAPAGRRPPRRRAPRPRPRRAAPRCRARCGSASACTRPGTRTPRGTACSGTRPRDGLSPNSPHAADGMRIDPPPSFPCAIGTMPDATAAADPPLEPPAERHEVVRVAGRAVEQRLGGAVLPELGRVGHAEHDHARAHVPAPPPGCRRSPRRRPRAASRAMWAAPSPCAPRPSPRRARRRTVPSPSGRLRRASSRAASNRVATIACTSGSIASMPADGCVDRFDRRHVTALGSRRPGRVPSSSSYQPSAAASTMRAHPTEVVRAHARGRGSVARSGAGPSAKGD